MNPTNILKPATHLAIFADRRDRRKLPGVPGAAIAIFAGRRDRRIYKIRRHSPSVPVPAMFYAHQCESPVKSINQVGRFYHDFSERSSMEPGKVEVPGVSSSIGGENHLRFSLAIKFAAIGVSFNEDHLNSFCSFSCVLFFFLKTFRILGDIQSKSSSNLITIKSTFPNPH